MWISGTVDTHEHHLEPFVKCLIERGYAEIIDEGDISVNRHLIILSYKSANFFGYRGEPTSRSLLLLEDIVEKKTVSSSW